MKKGLTTLFTLALALCLVLNLAACGGSSSSVVASEPTEAPSSEVAPARKADDGDVATATGSQYEIIDEEYRFAWIGWGSTDYVGGSIQRYLEYLDEQMPEVTWTYSDAGANMDANAMLAETEALCQSGVDAIFCFLPTAAMADACKNAGVWYGSATNLVSDKELLDYLDSTGIWLGYNPHGGDYEEGWTSLEAMYDAGDRNFVILASQPGHPAGDARISGMQDFLASKDDVTLLGEYRGTDFATGLSDLIALHGDAIEAVGLTSGANGGLEAAYNALSAAGIEAHCTVLDITDTAQELFDADVLKYMSAGNAIDVGTMSVVALNALMGDYEGPVYMYPRYIPMYNSQDVENFSNAVDGEIPPFTADELRAWMKCYNPDATDAGYIEYIETEYTLDSIMERHAGMI